MYVGSGMSAWADGVPLAGGFKASGKDAVSKIGARLSSFAVQPWGHAEKGIRMALKLLSKMQAQELEPICHHFDAATNMHAGKKQSQWHEMPGVVMAWPWWHGLIEWQPLAGIAVPLAWAVRGFRRKKKRPSSIRICMPVWSGQRGNI